MNKEEILIKARNNILKTEKVFISDWDCEVIVKELSGKLYLDVSNDCLVGTEVDKKKFLNYAIISSVYDLDNNQIFNDKDIDTILNMSADGYSALVLAITKLNNLDEGKNQKNLKKAN